RAPLPSCEYRQWYRRGPTRARTAAAGLQQARRASRLDRTALRLPRRGAKSGASAPVDGASNRATCPEGCRRSEGDGRETSTADRPTAWQATTTAWRAAQPSG